MLTNDDLTILRRPFKPEEHEFNRGLVYIKEDAITTRIEEVDPNWSFEILSTMQRGNQVSITARMTINGTTRDGVGMDNVLYMTDKVDPKTGEILERRSHLEANEAEKSAATDALKRCARLFGVGRYLLSMPRSIKEEKALAKWLNQQTPWTTPENIATLIDKITTAIPGTTEAAILAAAGASSRTDVAAWGKFDTGSAAYAAITVKLNTGAFGSKKEAGSDAQAPLPPTRSSSATGKNEQPPKPKASTAPASSRA
jgi:hypothetical protein